MGSRVDEKRGEGRGTLRVPGARQPRGDARHDAPRRALPHPLAISRQAIRRRVQTRGFVRLRVATHARGGAIMVRVRGRGERSEPGRHRRETSSLGRRVRHTRGVALTVGGGARTRVVRRHVATRQRRVSPPRQRGTRTPGLVFGRRDESAADAQPSVVPVHPRAGGGCRGTPRRGRRRNVARRRFRVGVGGGVSSGVPGDPAAQRLRRGGGSFVSRGGYHWRGSARKPRGAQTLVRAVRGARHHRRRRFTKGWRVARLGELRAGRRARIPAALRAPHRHRPAPRVDRRRPTPLGLRVASIRSPGAVPQARHAHVHVAPSRVVEVPGGRRAQG